MQRKTKCNENDDKKFGKRPNKLQRSFAILLNQNRSLLEKNRTLLNWIIFPLCFIMHIVCELNN